MYHRRDIGVEGSSEDVIVFSAEDEPICNTCVSIYFLYQKLIILQEQPFIVSIVVSIPACNAGDRGSISRLAGLAFSINFFFFL